MTALNQYQRLEAPGVWRPDAQAQRINVIVSLGDATLVISDMSDRALTHWSLPALKRTNPGSRPALYVPAGEATEGETLEVDDDDMIAAIDKVRRAIERNRPRSGRLRLVLGALGVAAGLALAAFWLPDALRQHALSVLPDATRAEVGERLLTRMRRVAGAPCAGAYGSVALDRLGARVLGGASRVVVVSAGVARARHLPGGIVLLNRALVEDYETPEVAAGFLLAEQLRARRSDPMAGLLDAAGMLATVTLLTTGEIADEALDTYAETLLTSRPAPLPDAALLERFEALGLRATPYAYALDPSGETTLGLIEADPVPLSAAAPLLSDSDWVSLQGICAS